MSEVPDDLMKAAREACRCFDEPKGCVLLDPQSCSDDCDLAFRFSRALAAERERATLAERERWQIPQLQSTIFRAVRP